MKIVVTGAPEFKERWVRLADEALRRATAKLADDLLQAVADDYREFVRRRAALYLRERAERKK